MRGVRRGEREQQSRLREIQPVEEDVDPVHRHQPVAEVRCRIDQAGAHERGAGAGEHAERERHESGAEKREQQALVGCGELFQVVEQWMWCHGRLSESGIRRR